MKKLALKPTTILISLGLILLSAVICAGYFGRDIPSGSRVIYVSDSDKSEFIASGGYSDGLIHLNKATAEELTKISGIGEALAEKIIAYRDEVGGFRSKEELLNINGIGEKIYEKIAPYVLLD